MNIKVAFGKFINNSIVAENNFVMIFAFSIIFIIWNVEIHHVVCFQISILYFF